MTTKQTIKALKSAGKPVSLSHLYRLFSVLGIKPIGRSRPQQYPADSVERILRHLGHLAVNVSSVKRGAFQVKKLKLNLNRKMKIKQIIPADGWQAVYKNDDGSEYKSQMNCWALIEDERGETRIEGMDVDSDGVCSEANLSTNFLRYERPLAKS